MCHPEPFAYGRPSDDTQSDCTVILKEPFGIVILSGVKDLAFDASGLNSATLAQRMAGGEESRSGQAPRRLCPAKKEILHLRLRMTGGEWFRRLPEQSEGMTNHTVTKSLPHDIMRKNLCPRI